VNDKRHNAPITRQVCQSKLTPGPVKFAAQVGSTRASLTRAGIVYATGYARVNRAGAMFRLMAARKLRAGRYMLVLKRRNGHRLDIVRYSVRISS
jgi:hypothetical protein